MATPVDVRYAVPGHRSLIAGTFAGGKFAGNPALGSAVPAGELLSIPSHLIGTARVTDAIASGSVAGVDVPPSWVPSAGGVATINLNSLASVNACPSNACWYSQNDKQSAPWRNWTGAVFADQFSEYGAMLYWGGGHNGGEDSSIYCFDLTTRLWSRIGPEMPTFEYHGGASHPALDSTFYDYLWQGSYIVPALHTYGYPFYLPPGLPGAGPKGSWVIPQLVGNANSGAVPHMVDLDTGVWSRMTTNKLYQDTGSTYASAFVDRKRNKVYWGSLYGSSLLAMDLNEQHPRTMYRQAGASMGGIIYYPCHVYVPEADAVIGFGMQYGQTRIEYELIELSTGLPRNPATIANATFGGNYNMPPTAGGGLPSAVSADWCPETQSFYLYGGYGSTEVVKLTPSSLNFATCSWTMTTEPFPGAAMAAGGLASQGAQPFTRWKYIRKLRSFVWSDGPNVSLPNTETGISNPGAFQLWRPLGT